ncbi:EFR1 family ferrodoxin [Scatolibacter rhodanostii]|uniref:EFR1 family ferrodoxin n=1 Tax=Scatolibacter rhodanostii TaxID=2014781 RepID=UPI000C07B8F6|nr:EFR1 family ferrodoxin [Scatolibacter rhodanostii]
MNIYSNIKIAYYSGTGGTELAAKTLQNTIIKAGCVCTLERIAFDMKTSDRKFDLLILLFPVHAFNAPHAVYQWLDGLETIRNVNAAVISVSGAGEVCPNTACRVGSMKRLCKKGYHVVYERMLVMPSNWVSLPPNPLPYLLIKALPIAIEQISHDILSGIIKKSSPLWIDRLFSKLGKLETAGGHYFGKRIKVLENCTKCGWCVKNCPSGNIVLQNGMPTFSDKCHFCLKCIYGCTSKALQPGTCKFVVIPEGYCLQHIAQRPPQNSQLPMKDLKVGFFWSGVKKYLLSLNTHQHDGSK